MAITCIFLAAKVEENWKSLEQVIEAAHGVRHNEKLGKLEPAEMTSMQNKVLMYERVVLNTLSFEVSVEHHHKFADKFVKMVTTAQTKEYFDLLQVTWNVMNDSLSTTMCLRYPPRLIAAAAVSLAIRMIKARAIAGSISRPRLLDVVSKFEKQGRLFEYKLAELRALEDELIRFHESFDQSSNPPKMAPATAEVSDPSVKKARLE